MSKNGKHLKFHYDYMGRRVEKKVWNNTGGTGTPTVHLKFVYNGMELIAELDGDKNLLKTFHWGLDKSGTRGGSGGAMGLTMMRIHSGTHMGSYYPVYDMNGNVTGMLNSSGTFSAWYEYDGFGKKITDGGTSGFEDENPIQFSTQYTDKETGLVYYGFRYYNPEIGRFITRDPIGEQGGANLYRFVDNDPVHNVDLFGLCKDPGPKPTVSNHSESELDDEILRWERKKEDYELCLAEQQEPVDLDPYKIDGGVGGSSYTPAISMFYITLGGLRPNLRLDFAGVGGVGATAQKEDEKDEDCLGVKDPKTGQINPISNQNGRHIRVPETDNRGNSFDINGSVELAQENAVGPPWFPSMTIGNAIWFRDQVKTNGPWDFKQIDSKFEDFGNFFYGAAGSAAGFPPGILYWQAGEAQKRNRTSQPQWDVAPYHGDDPQDYFNIKQGVDSFDFNWRGEYDNYARIPCKD